MFTGEQQQQEQQQQVVYCIDLTSKVQKKIIVVAGNYNKRCGKRWTKLTPKGLTQLEANARHSGVGKGVRVLSKSKAESKLSGKLRLSL